MKKVILGIIIGVLVTSGVGVLAYNYNAKDVSYTPSDSSWNVSNVEEAINDLKNGTDEYKNKSYTTEGIQIYDNRITILDGGYYTDSNGTTYVNIKFKVNKNLAGNNAWVLVYGLPTSSKKTVFTDLDKKYTFKFNFEHSTTFLNNISYFDHSNTTIFADEVVTVQFKY